jgi:hypothetical protein
VAQLYSTSHSERARVAKDIRRAIGFRAKQYHTLLLNQEDDMKARAVVLILALCFVGAAASFGADDAFMGTWKRNDAKSKTRAGGPKNDTVVYEAAGDNVKITIEGTGPDGTPRHSEWSGKFDGKSYPVIGDPTEDERSYRKVDDHTLAFTVKKDGKITETGRIVVAPDGKSRTVTTHDTDAKGMKTSSTVVYDKQ